MQEASFLPLPAELVALIEQKKWFGQYMYQSEYGTAYWKDETTSDNIFRFCQEYWGREGLQFLF
jgi:hypothetical protein